MSGRVGRNYPVNEFGGHGAIFFTSQGYRLFQKHKAGSTKAKNRECPWMAALSDFY